MGNFFAELKRRHIYRVGAAYAVVAWVLLQLVNNIAPVLDLPPWVARAILLVLIIGFPLALLLAWIVEAAPEPARKSKRGVAQPAADSRVDWVLAGALALVIAIFAYQQLAPLPPAAKQAGVETARVASSTQASAIAIAVLPFVNLSGDAGQEFFSDGMTEEITSALAKVPDLRVVGRTSAFQFKGQNQDLRAIGRSLAATHLIEGSVRKAGDRLRVTVQLIKADDGTHVWAEDYDRNLTDIFAVQEDIARTITTSLRMPLGLKPGENLVNNRSIDPESYQQYLRARALLQTGGLSTLGETVALLEQVVARDRDYAPAWAELAHAYFWTITFSPQRITGSVEEFRRLVDVQLSKSEAAAKRAVQLDPNLAAGYLWLGPAALERGDILAAFELGSKALALDPNNPEILGWHSSNLAIVGRVKESNAMKQQEVALEPFVPASNIWAAAYLWVDGQSDTAIAMLNALPPNSLPHPRLAMIYASMGRYAEAADLMEHTTPREPGAALAKDAARLLRTAPAKAAAPESLPRLGIFDWVYLSVGAPGRALENRERSIASGYPIDLPTPFIWHASWAPVRKTERFKTYVRKLGLVDFWRAKGWPEFCHPTTGDDFACD